MDADKPQPLTNSSGSFSDEFESISNAIANGSDLSEILQLIVWHTTELLEVERAYVFLKSGEDLSLQLRAASDQTPLEQPVVALPDSLEVWVVKRGRSLALPIIPARLGQPASELSLRSTMLKAEEDATSVVQLVVPVRNGAVTVGVLEVITSLTLVTSAGSSAFSANQILSFLAVLADLVSLALENRQILKRQERRSQLIDLLRFISQPLPSDSPLSLSESAGSIANQISLACGAEKVDIMVHSPETDELVTLGTNDSSLSQLQVQLGLDHLSLATAGRLTEVYLTGQPFLSGQVISADQVDHVERLGVKSFLIVPLRVEGQSQGVISLASPRGQAFSEEDLSFINFVSLRLGYSLRHQELTEELAQAEATRIQSDERDNFIAIVAHDLKNALAVIRGNSQLSLRKISRGDFSFSERAQQASLLKANQALVLVEDMVEVNQIDKGSFRLFRSEVELVSLVLEEIEAVQSLDPNASLSFSSEYKEVVLSADPNRLRQVLSNLILNALRYSPPARPVALSITSAPSLDHIKTKFAPELVQVQAGQEVKVVEGPLVMITVADQGIGITEADQLRIFERFYRGHGAQMASGSGLGLYISREIMLQHGGQIWVESQEGHGSQFHLTLPALRLT